MNKQKRYKLDLDYWFDWQDFIWDKVNYNPYPWQRDFHKRDERDGILHANSRGGKSLMKSNEALPLLLLPDQHIWIVSATYDLGSYEWIYAVEGCAEAKTLGINHLKSKYRKYKDIKIRESHHDIKTPWGSFIKCKSIRTGGAEEAEGVDLMIISEASNKNIPIRFYEQFMQPRLTDRKGSFAIASALRGKAPFTHWCTERAKRDDCYFAGGITAYDCPHIDPEEIARNKEIMPDKYFRERMLGEEVAYLGEIIPSFNHFDNVLFEPESEVDDNRLRIQNLKPMFNWFKCDLFGAVYYGFGGKRTVFLLLAFNPENDMLYVIDELVFGDQITSLKLGNKIKILLNWWNLDEETTIFSNQSLFTTLEKTGLYGGEFIEDDFRELKSSLGRTDTYFELNKIKVADSLGGLKFSLDNYIWDIEKDEPLPENFEAVECLRIALEGFETGCDYFDPQDFEDFKGMLGSTTKFGDIR